MNIISVPGQSGRSYSVRIAGAQPTPEEQARIDSFIAQREASTAANVARFLGPTAGTAPTEEPQGGLGSAFGVGVDTLQQGYGSTLEGIGSILGVEGIQRYGQKVAETNAREAAEKAQALTGREDIDSFGSAVSFFGETLAQQVPQLGVSLGGAAAGAMAGSAIPVVGTAAGAIIGGVAANLPFFYGQNRERQKEAIELGLRTEVDEGAAFLTALPQAALDTIVDRLMIGKVVNPEFIRAGGIFTRAVKGATAGAAVEVPTEIGQAVLERYQAGLPIDSEDAIREYEDVAIAAGLVGGTLSGSINVAAGDIRKKKEAEEEKEALTQLLEDQQEMVGDVENRIKFGLAAADKEAQEQTLSTEERTLALPKPSRLTPDQEVTAIAAAANGKMDDLKAGDITPTSQRTFELAQYDAALERTRKNGKFSLGAIQSAAAKASGGKVPMSVARDIRDEMVRRGVLRADTQSASGYTLEPEKAERFSEAESLQKTMDDLERSIEADRKERERAMLGARRLEQTGAKRPAVRAEALKADQAEARIAQAEKTRAEVRQRLANVDQSGVVPTTERPRSLLKDGQVVTPIGEATPAQQRLGVGRQGENLQRSLDQYNTRIRQQRAILARLKADAKKVQLPKSELAKMDAIQRGIDADLYAVEAIKDRMRNPSADIQIAQEQARANEARLAAEKARRAARTPIYTGQEQNVFNALRKRLTNLGLGDVRLTAEKILRPQDARSGSLIEGMFDVEDGNRVIALSMGIFDPNLNAQQQFDALSGVMNHEVIHALRNLGLFTDAEWRSLSELARRQKYMAVKGGKAVERKYTYFQRAQQMYPESSQDVQVEEAVAEMFRDYMDKKLKVGGKPRTLMERIKDFFRAIWGAHSDAGIDPNTIFEGVRFGQIGGRERKPVEPEEGERLSRLRVEPLPPGVATEEEVRDPRDIVMPIDPTVPDDLVRGQIKALTGQNVELVKDLIADIDRKFRTKSGDNIKDLAKVTQKAKRPSILAKKPWHTVAHIRDSYRFKTVIDDFRDVPGIFNELLKSGVGLVKIDTNKLFEPGQWGWRIIAFDLRMPNGQLVEWYLPVKELEDQKKREGHLIFEEWRNKTQAQLLAEQDQYLSSIARSFEGYDRAFQAALDRIGLTRQEAEASWRSAESSVLEAARNSRNSSGVMTSSSVSNRGFQTPSNVRMDREPSSLNRMTRGVLSSTSANADAISGTSPESVAVTAPEDNLTPQQQQALRPAVEASTRYSALNMRPLPSPVKKKDGSTTVVYGVMMDGSNPRHVILPEGQHTSMGGVEAGHGMAHIIARNHDKELFENSRYTSVQQAIVDLLYRWQKQGYRDGEDVIGYRWGDGFTLEWVNNLTRKSPPLVLAIHKTDAGGYPFFYVKTFYPKLDHDKRYSRIKLPENLRRYTVLDLYDDMGNFIDLAPIGPNGKRMTVPKEQALTTFHKKRGRKVFTSSLKDVKALSQMLAAEADAALATDSTAIGWYDEKLRTAKELTALLHPEIKTDLGMEAAFDFALAVTSNGVAVLENHRMANEQYEALKATGRFPVVGFGQQGMPMKHAFAFYNGLLDRGFDHIGIADYLSQNTTVGQLKKDPLLKEMDVAVGGKEWDATPVNVSYVLGPKIGQGFYQNVRGNFEPLTMDRWWVRMFNRIAGNQFVTVTDERLKKNIEDFKAAARGQLNEYEQNVLTDAIAETMADVTTDETAIRIAREVNRIFQRDFKKAEKEARPVKSALFQTANTLSDNSKKQVEEAPRGAAERAFMREVASRARDQVNEALRRSGSNQSLTMADFQALMWYAEKRLWDAMGIRKGKGGEHDYVDSAIELLRSKGISDDKIAETLPGADRYRIDPERYPRDTDRGIYRQAPASGTAPVSDERFSRLETKGAGGRDGSGRQAGRGVAPLEGAPRVQGASGPDLNLVRVAEDYARSIGIDLKRQSEFVEVDEERAKRIAAAYDAMPHAPQDPVVKEAYQNLIQQTIAQYRALENAGYKFWFIDPENIGTYADSPWNAMRDLRANKSMGVFPTAGGFGSGATDLDVNDNPMLVDTGVTWPWGSPDGEPTPVLANDLFRAVHDAFGHGLEGAGFRARGEENAWQAHIRLFTGSAQGAITSETRGQNSWLNYGPYGEKNRNAKTEDTVFADQKTGLMPEWTWLEGRAGDMEFPGTARASRLSALPAMSQQSMRQVPANQRQLMYARSADVIGKILNLKGYGLKQESVDNFLRKFQDSMLPVGRMVQELSERGLTITDAMDPYLQEELMHGVVGHRIEQNQAKLYEPATEAIKKLNVSQADIDRLKKASDATGNDPSGKGFVSLALEAGGSVRVALADAYLYAKHAKERNKYIREVRDPTNTSGSGMTDAEADAILNWFNSLQGPNRQAVAEFHQVIVRIIADTNKTRLDAGLISQEMIDAGPQWQFYVPLRGVFDPDGDRAEEEYQGPPGSPRYGAKGREDRRALGRYGAARDIVANVFTQNQNAILRAERNKVGQSFLNLLRADRAGTKGYAEILDRRPMMRAPDAKGRLREVVNMRAGDDPDMLVVKEDGKEVFVRFADLRLAGAMNGRNGYSPTSMSWLINSMSKVNRYLASINTSYNPEFMITNAFRDLQTAGVNVNQFEREGMTKDMLGNLRSALAGIRRSIRDKDDSSEWSKIYRDFVAAGGQNATNQFNSLTEQIENIDTLLNDIAENGARGAWVKVKNSFVGKGAGSLLQLVEDYNTVVENGVRVSTYKALLDRGFTRERAAQAARNVTVNFAKGGDYRLLMNSMYLFYNASIQGTFAMLNAATRSAKVRKLWAGVVVVGILQDQLNAALSDTDDDGELLYDKIPNYVTERNLIFPDFIGLSDRSYIAIPMPYGLNMAVNLGRQMSRVARGVADPSEATGNVFAVAVDVLNPIGGTESFANAVAPTIADPFIDIIENEDFANKPIYKEGLPFDRTPSPDSQMYWNSTSATAKWVTDNLNSLTGGNAVRSGLADFSPDVVEYWFSFLTGGVGRFVLNTGELPFNLAVDGLSDDIVRNIPVVRRTFGSVSEREDMGEYMERASRVLMAGEELKQARESGDAKWAQETVQQYQRELRLLGQVKNFETELRKISRRMNEIEKNRDIPEAQKRVIKDALDQRKQMILSNANRILRTLE